MFSHFPNMKMGSDVQAYSDRRMFERAPGVSEGVQKKVAN